jgi:hypothetical protein
VAASGSRRLRRQLRRVGPGWLAGAYAAGVDGGGSDVYRVKDGRRWRVGGDAEVAWIRSATEPGLTLRSGIPPVFEAYATVGLPGSEDRDQAAGSEDPRRYDAAVLAVLGRFTSPQSWWLGYLETGASDLGFVDVPKVTLYSNWSYVLVEAGPEQAGRWRQDDHWKGVLPDLMFPADRSWLLSTLWDDDWSCLGGPQELVQQFLEDSCLGDRTRAVELSAADATPPGHTAR